MISRSVLEKYRRQFSGDYEGERGKGDVDDRHCCAGYTWVELEKFEGYIVYKCEGGAHICFKRRIRKKKPTRKGKTLEVDAAGNKIEAHTKGVEDNILE